MWAALIPAIMGAIQMGVGAVKQSQINKSQQAKFGLTPDMQKAKSQAETMAQQGFMPQEKAAYMQNIASSQNAAQRAATDISGGNMSKAISAILGASKLRGFNELAVQDAALRRQNIQNRNAIYGQEQGLENQNTQVQLNNRAQQQQAAGQLMQSGLGNMVSGVQSGIGGFQKADMAKNYIDAYAADNPNIAPEKLEALYKIGRTGNVPYEVTVAPQMAMYDKMYGTGNATGKMMPQAGVVDATITTDANTNARRMPSWMLKPIGKAPQVTVPPYGGNDVYDPYNFNNYKKAWYNYRLNPQ